MNYSIDDIKFFYIFRLFSIQKPGLVEGLDDDEIQNNIPRDFWLKNNNTRCLLAAMVHRKNKEIATDYSSQEAGSTRANIREGSRIRLKKTG